MSLFTMVPTPSLLITNITKEPCMIKYMRSRGLRRARDIRPYATLLGLYWILTHLWIVRCSRLVVHVPGLPSATLEVTVLHVGAHRAAAPNGLIICLGYSISGPWGCLTLNSPHKGTLCCVVYRKPKRAVHHLQAKFGRRKARGK